MEFHSSTEPGLDYLLGLDGNIEFQNDEGYWVKMEVRRATVSSERPYGIRYSLTLHAPDGTRLLGFDNAHGGIKPEGARFLHAGKKYPTITCTAMPTIRVCSINLIQLTS